MDIDVHDIPDSARYEARLDGALLGYAAYALTDGVVVFKHTVVEPNHEGRGVGSALVQAALDDVRQRQLKAVPRCSFVRDWLDRHPTYADLVLDANP